MTTQTIQYEAEFKCRECQTRYVGRGPGLEAAMSAMRRNHNSNSRTCGRLLGTVTVRNKRTRRVLATTELDQWLHF